MHLERSAKAKEKVLFRANKAKFATLGFNRWNTVKSRTYKRDAKPKGPEAKVKWREKKGWLEAEFDLSPGEIATLYVKQ